MHNNNRPMTMNDRVALARWKRLNSGDIWPGDRPEFDGSVVYRDASPEYVGSRAKDPVSQIDGRPIEFPSSRPITIRLVDIKVRESHPSRP